MGVLLNILSSILRLALSRYSQFIETTNDVSTREYTIKSICEVLGGSTPSRTNPAYWEGGTIPWLTVDDIHDQGKYISETRQHLTKLGLSKTRIYPKDSVLICCTSASIGSFALAKIELSSNQQFNALVIKDKNVLIPEYLLYLVSMLKPKLLRVSGKTTFPFVSKSNLEGLTLKFPPISIQEEFAAFARQADKSESLHLKVA